MANTYYNATGNPLTRTTLSSSAMRAEFASIQAAFDRLPPAFGAQGFNGGTWMNATISGATIVQSTFASTANADTHFGDGTNALATNATFGFVFIPKMAGAPSGTPYNATTSSAPIVIDTTNSRIYVRIGASWKYAALT